MKFATLSLLCIALASQASALPVDVNVPAPAVGNEGTNNTTTLLKAVATTGKKKEGFAEASYWFNRFRSSSQSRFFDDDATKNTLPANE